VDLLYRFLMYPQEDKNNKEVQVNVSNYSGHSQPLTIMQASTAEQGLDSMASEASSSTVGNKSQPSMRQNWSVIIHTARRSSKSRPFIPLPTHRHARTGLSVSHSSTTLLDVSVYNLKPAWLPTCSCSSGSQYAFPADRLPGHLVACSSVPSSGSRLTHNLMVASHVMNWSVRIRAAARSVAPFMQSFTPFRSARLSLNISPASLRIEGGTGRENGSGCYLRRSFRSHSGEHRGEDRRKDTIVYWHGCVWPSGCAQALLSHGGLLRPRNACKYNLQPWHRGDVRASPALLIQKRQVNRRSFWTTPRGKYAEDLPTCSRPKEGHLPHALYLPIFRRMYINGVKSYGSFPDGVRHKS
jgi:hypothetical protein